MATEIALPGAPSWATTALGIVLPKNVTATYSHRVKKPEGSIDAMRALAVTPSALLDIQMVVGEDDVHFERAEKTSIRTIPLRRISGVSHLVDLARGDNNETRDALRCSLEISLTDPEEKIALPFDEKDFGGDRKPRIDAINAVSFALSAALSGNDSEGT